MTNQPFGIRGQVGSEGRANRRKDAGNSMIVHRTVDFTRLYRFRGLYNHPVARSLERLTDNQLLDLRFCDLSLKMKGTPVEQRVAKLYRELDVCELRFHPHVWWGEEWYTPDGVGGFAIPFYLAHPRLMKLERTQMLEVEGASEGQ